MAIALTESNKEAIRYHLGYHNVEPTPSVNLGFPSSNQQLFLLESAMERLVNQHAVSRVQRCLAELDDCENQISESRKRFKAQQLGELKLRNSNDESNEADMLRAEYVDWANQLAGHFGVPLNANGNGRLRALLGGGGGTYRVTNRG